MEENIWKMGILMDYTFNFMNERHMNYL